MKLLKKILPHLNIIIVVVLVVLLIVDICNPFMEFINNNITKGFIWFLCALAIANSVVMLQEVYGKSHKAQTNNDEEEQE